MKHPLIDGLWCGRVVNDNGYITLSFTDEDFAKRVGAKRHKRGKTFVILEHRAVKALQIGRPLLRTEHIDHVDGNRANNHPDNLREVTLATHGAGQYNDDLKITVIANRILRQLLPPEYQELWTMVHDEADEYKATKCEVTAYMVVRDDEKRIKLRRPRRLTIFRDGKIVEHDDNRHWLKLKQTLLDRGDINGALEIEDIMEKGERSICQPPSSSA